MARSRPHRRIDPHFPATILPNVRANFVAAHDEIDHVHEEVESVYEEVKVLQGALGAERLPSVQRIRVINNFQDSSLSSNAHLFRVMLEFDRPVPAGWEVQYYRWAPRIHRTSGSGRLQVGWSAVWMANNATDGGFPRRSIPNGTNAMEVGTLLQLFRPPIVRNNGQFANNRWHVERRNNQIPTPILQRFGANMYNGKRGTRCVLKFGVSRMTPGGPGSSRVLGPMSSDTLTITLWKYSAIGWNLKAMLGGSLD